MIRANKSAPVCTIATPSASRSRSRACDHPATAHPPTDQPLRDFDRSPPQIVVVRGSVLQALLASPLMGRRKQSLREARSPSRREASSYDHYRNITVLWYSYPS